MKHAAALSGLVLAACTSGARSPGTGHPAAPAPAAASEPAAPAPDPTLGYRRQYSDPGGMWLPQQMTLPVHVDTFRDMGVAIDPRTLADPLTEPLDAVVAL